MRDAVKEKLIKYQDELCDIIDDYFERRNYQRSLFGDISEEDLKPVTMLIGEAYKEYVDHRRRSSHLIGRDGFKTQAIRWMGAHKNDEGKYVVEVAKLHDWLKRLSLRLN